MIILVYTILIPWKLNIKFVKIENMICINNFQKWRIFKNKYNKKFIRTHLSTFYFECIYDYIEISKYN